MKIHNLLPILMSGCVAAFAENRILPILPPAGYTGLTLKELSADGGLAVGLMNGGSSNRVFTWSAETVDFSIIRGISDTQVHGAVALSGDGSTVLGYSPDPANGNNSRPWIYRAGTLAQLTVPGSYEKPGARELSQDGSVVIGLVDINLSATTFAFRPAYWTIQPNGSQSFTLLSANPEFQVPGWLDLVDTTGRYLFGDYLVYASPASYDHYRYDRQTAGLLPLAAVHNVNLEECSADGSVVVYKTYQNRLAQWKDDQTTQAFEFLPSEGFMGYRYSFGGMTADASLVFGTEEKYNAFGGGTSASRLIYWDADRNLHDFTELFANSGVDTNGWNFGSVGGQINGVSTNGTRMVGRALYNGLLTAFYLELDPGNIVSPPPEFTLENVVVGQREGTKLVDIYYDVSSDATNLAEISVAISDGLSPVGSSSLSGDVGSSVITGAMKHIVWDAGADWAGNAADLTYTLYAGEGPLVIAATAPVAKTGQSTSYQAADDGDYQSGAEWPAPRFTTTVNGTAIDNLTGLEWVLEPSALGGNSGPVNWNNALAYCSNLAYAGGEWRLPSYKEMASLINFGNSAPSLPDGHPFVGIQTVYSYWTGSSSPWNTAAFALSVNLNYGQVFDGQKSSSGGVIWPVRGNPASAPAPVPVTGQVTSYSAGDDGDLQPGAAWPAPRFSDTGNGTVMDHLTGLEWVNTPHSLAGNSGLMSWSNAVEFCEGLDYASNQNWRLPNIKELESMVSLASNSPPSWLNGPATPFSGIFEGNYWSATTLAGSSGSARYVNTYLFSVGYLSKPSPVRVWPVRSVSTEPFSGAEQVVSSVDTRDYLLTVSSTHSLKTVVPGSALDVRIDLGDQSPAPGGNWTTIGTVSFSSGSPIALKDYATGLTSHGVTIRDGSGSQNAPLTMSGVWNSNASKDWVEPSAVADQLLSLGAHFYAIEGLDPAKTYRVEVLAASDVNNGAVQTHFIVDTVLGNPTRGYGWAPTSTINGTPSGTGSQVDNYELYTDGWAAANWLLWEDVVPGRHGYEGQGYGSDAIIVILSDASVGYLNAMRVSEASSPSVTTQNIAIASGSVLPGIGTHAYAWNSTVTAFVGSVVSAGGTNYASTGWLGDGSVPPLGNTQDTGPITLTELASSIDWRWMVDADTDLIPDHWELLYFGSETGAVATADIDEDGYTAAQEYILGSNPTNSGSSFLFTPGTNAPPGEFSVDFTTEPGRLYTVECTDELGSGTWQVLTNFIGDGSTTQIIDPANIPACFYQIRIDWTE